MFKLREGRLKHPIKNFKSKLYYEKNKTDQNKNVYV